MGWNRFGLRKRETPEVDPQLRDVWNAIRQVQQHIGGLPATLANHALAQSRMDARLESLANDLAAIRLHQLGAQLVDDEDQADEDQEVPEP